MRKRFRHIIAYPENGGKRCDLEDVEEANACEYCGDKSFCAWNEWEDWGSCSASCGDGKKGRRRYLALKEAPAKPPRSMTLRALEAKYLEVSRQHETLAANRMRELAVAFAAGCVSFVAIFAVIRCSVSWRRSSAFRGEDCRATAAPLYQHLEHETELGVRPAAE